MQVVHSLPGSIDTRLILYSLLLIVLHDYYINIPNEIVMRLRNNVINLDILNNIPNHCYVMHKASLLANMLA